MASEGSEFLRGVGVFSGGSRKGHEKARTGIRRMREDAKRHGCPEPQFKADGFFTATSWPTREKAGATQQVTEQVGTKLALSQHQVEVLRNCLKEQPLLKLMAVVGRSVPHLRSGRVRSRS